MRISLDWLRDYIDIDGDVDGLAEQLTMHGLEVENIERPGDRYDKFIVAKVLEVAKHPKADRLTVCKVDVGGEVLQIVCGAPNVAAGQLVPVGLVGATVPRNQHDPDGRPFLLSHVKVRDQDSHGMICSAYELDLGDDRDGIMILNSDSKVGTPLARYLGLEDTVLEIGVTPNRPDALSHIGVAREVGAFIGKKPRFPDSKITESKRKTSHVVSVLIEDTENCPRYTARVLSNLTIHSSPDWLQHRLKSVGIRPINNVVDVSNYVLMEMGQPLHTFDYDRLEGNKIVVRRAKEGEAFVTLDHKQRTLAPDTLLICDAGRPVAIAGVMGGENTEITNSTRHVLIESAYFKPQSIRRTAKRFGLSTDASQRFERGADPNITVAAVNRAAALLQQISGAEVLQGIVDVYPRKIKPRVIRLRVQKANELLGTSLSANVISAGLQKLELRSRVLTKQMGGRETLSVTVPTFRVDIDREIDLIEEIGRIYGYDEIETKTRSSLELGITAPKKPIASEIREWLSGCGYNEIVTNSMQKEHEASEGVVTVTIANPISRDMVAMRTDLLHSGLEVVRNNLAHRTLNLRLFELGKAYFRIPGAPGNQLDDYREEEQLVLLLSGAGNPPHWSQATRNVDLFDLKGEIEALLTKFSLDKHKFIPYPKPKALTESALSLVIDGTEVGWLGAVHQEMLQRFEIGQDVLVAQLRVEALAAKRRVDRQYVPPAKYPSVSRDVAFVVDTSVQAGDVIAEIERAGKPELRGVDVLSVFIGSSETPVPPGKKSCAFTLDIQAEDHTFTREEIDRLMQKIIDHVSKKFDATIRA
jgi:phenylalanyl-tRNA synthetase beta chain